MYETILVPTDGSEAAERAAAEAVALAAHHGATVHALYVIDVTAIAWATAEDTDLGADVGNLREAFERDGARATAAVADLAADRGVEAVTTVEEGVPFRAILEYADEHGVDLVVMGTRGRRGLDVVFGSTTERVVRRAHVPVLTVRYEPDE